jgi:hypothetical protein
MAKKDSVEMLEAKIEVLTRARKNIETGKYRGICAAIYFSWDWCCSKEFITASNTLRNYISNILGCNRLVYYRYLDNWLEEKRPKLNRSDKSMKQYRLQWIDWMLSCLQEDLGEKKAKKK